MKRCYFCAFMLLLMLFGCSKKMSDDDFIIITSERQMEDSKSIISTDPEIELDILCKKYNYTLDQYKQKLKHLEKELKSEYIKERIQKLTYQKIILELEADKIEEGADIGSLMNKSEEIIRKRLDYMGVKKNKITKVNNSTMSIELLSFKGPERIKYYISKNALLEFRLVEDKRKVSEFLDNDNQVMKDKLPEDLEVMDSKEERIYLLKKQPELTGACIENAQVKIGGQSGMPYIALDLNKTGGEIFEKITEMNINRNLAIVLDRIVQTAPVIKSRISDGHLIIEGNFSVEEAMDLAVLLKTETLPAQYRIVENRVLILMIKDDTVKEQL